MIGSSGFVGTNLQTQLNFDYLYNSSNINSIGESDHDVVICCGIAANKRWSNQNVEEDKKKIDNLLDRLFLSLNCNKFILVSTIDIYSDNAYGKNRMYAENKLNLFFGDKLHIVRLPACFGNGLKKNILFDLINQKYYGRINLLDELQFYHINRLSYDIDYMVRKNWKELNLFTEPISLGIIVEEFFKTDLDVMYEDAKNVTKYDFKCNHSLTGYWLSKQEVLNDIKKWLKEY